MTQVADKVPPASAARYIVQGWFADHEDEVIRAYYHSSLGVRMLASLDGDRIVLAAGDETPMFTVSSCGLDRVTDATLDSGVLALELDRSDDLLELTAE